MICLNKFPNKDEFCKMTEKFNVVPLCTEILADIETPVSVLKKFHKEDSPLFLFESVEGGEKWGRYSFLGTSAKANIRVFLNDIEIESDNEIKLIPHKGDPLSALREIINSYNAPEITSLPKFWGGLVGYLKYEVVSFFEKIKHKLPKDKPFAHFIIPDEVIIFDNIKKTMICVAVSFIEDKNSLKYINSEDSYKNVRKRLQKMVDTINTKFCEIETQNSKLQDKKELQLKPLCSKENYMARVAKVKDHIYKGDVIQTVISQQFCCDAPDDITELYRAQRYINPSPYLFFLKLQDISLIGSSPETMVCLENQIATLRPIAGTRPRGKTQHEDRVFADELLADEKEKAEHLMLVDLGRNDLGRVAETGTVQVTDLMFVERYSHVMHLVSNIICDVTPNCDAFDLLRATFPAGTLSGAPKVRAMEIISEIEDKPRGPYGGAAGYISFSGNMDLAITIRTAIIENKKLTVRAGAGIVYDSNPEKEWEECINKAKAIENALELLKKGL